MTREEAANILTFGISVLPYDVRRCGNLPDAMRQGAAALRRLDELVRWGEAWKEHNSGPYWHYFFDAINGEMEWPVPAEDATGWLEDK